MSTLKKLYRLFLRDKVNEQYELSYIEGAVLGENILNGYYFLVLRKIDWESDKVYHYLLTENCKTPSLIKIKEYDKNPNKYQRFNKSILKNELEPRGFNALINNGLFQSSDAGKSILDNITTIHRLNSCIYSNILNLEIHHGNKRKCRNEITNLTPIIKTVHDELDMLEEPQFTIETKRLHEAFKKSLKINKRNTLSNRDEVVFEILLDLDKGLTPSEIVSNWDNKIGLTKIYEIKNHYFYLKEFLDFLYNLIFKERWTLNENYDCQWEYIKEFEGSYDLRNDCSESFYNKKLTAVKEIFQKYLISKREGYY